MDSLLWAVTKKQKARNNPGLECNWRGRGAGNRQARGLPDQAQALGTSSRARLSINRVLPIKAATRITS